MQGLFETIINSDNLNILENFVTPVLPYFICGHFISTEINSNNYKYIGTDLSMKSNDLLKNKNYDDIKNLDIIQVQVDYFDFFHDEVLPIIINKNIQVIIITSQWHLPQIQRSEKTDNVLNNKNILLWISQNPIYEDNEKYMAFPYGLSQHKITDYINFVKSHYSDIEKNTKILNQCSLVHGHLPDNHIRRMYDIFGMNSGPNLNYNEFLNNIAMSEFVISTTGDREDCYRHYECIGLNAIPVSNISKKYVDIFQDNMVYSTPDEMVDMVTNKIVNYDYKPPNRDILTTVYWLGKINAKITLLRIYPKEAYDLSTDKSSQNGLPSGNCAKV
jgi:hypothetical protein